MAKRKHEVIGRWPDRISFILDVSGTSVEDVGRGRNWRPRDQLGGHQLGAQNLN